MSVLAYPSGYQPSTDEADGAVRALRVVAGIEAVAVAVVLGTLVLAWPPAGAMTAGQEGAALGDVVPALGWLRLGAVGLGAVLFLRWLHRAVANLGVLVPASTSLLTPARAVGCWFLPGWNLVRPFVVLLDLWELSHHAAGDEPRGTRTAARVAWWWSLLLVGTLLTRLDFMVDDDRALVAAGFVAGGVMRIAAARLLVGIVRTVSALHEDQARRIACTRLPQPAGLAPVMA